MPENRSLTLNMTRSAAFMCAALLLFLIPQAHAQNSENNSENNLEALGIPPSTEGAEDVIPAPVDNSVQAPPSNEEMGDLLKKIESDPVAATPPTVTPAIVQETNAQPPTDKQLSSPAPVESTVNVPSVPALPPSAAVDENLFFDSEEVEAASEIRPSAPRKVSPKEEKGSSLVIVKKDYEAGSEQAQIVSAQRAIQLRRYDSALRIYEGLYQRNQSDPNILLGRAIAMQKLGHIDEAIRSYEELLNLRPDNVEAQINMLGLIGERYPAVALQRLKEMETGNDMRVMAQIGILEAQLGHYSEAMSSLGIAASMDQNNATHYFNMAVIADRAGKKDDAVRYYEKALETDTVYGGSQTIPRDSVFERLAQLR